MDSINSKLQAVLQEHLKLPSSIGEIPANEHLDRLGLDSMTVIGILLDLERVFEVEIPDTMLTADTFRTFSTLKDAISSLFAEGS